MIFYTVCQKLAHNPSLHKYRAEQIVILNDKLQRLESRPVAPPRQTSQTSLILPRNPLKERSDKEKRKEIENLREQNERLTSDASDARRRTEAAVARTRALERDNKELKLKMGTLLSKMETDDKLIAALQDKKVKFSAVRRLLMFIVCIY